MTRTLTITAAIATLAVGVFAYPVIIGLAKSRSGR
jgi:hypothetical protein